MKNLFELAPDQLKSYLEDLPSEHSSIELKKANNNLPKAFWETYSSFANTSGGYVVLGISETQRGEKNQITGVGDGVKIERALWNGLTNPEKVSTNTLENGDFRTINFNGRDVQLIYVPEARLNKKPVYLNGNPDLAFIRLGEGDRRIGEDDLEAMRRDAVANMDMKILRDCTIDDLDLDTVQRYQKLVSDSYPGRKFDQLSEEDFLEKIGALQTVSRYPGLHPTEGVLLFLGKINSIRRYFPHYHVDYFERMEPGIRWTDRICDDEPSDYEMNLFTFYQLVMDHMKHVIPYPFRLNEDMHRMSKDHLISVIREALINVLAHTDYWRPFTVVKIEVFPDKVSFYNSGKFLVSVEQFFKGGISRPRNQSIMGLFRRCGLSERQGQGGAIIYDTLSEFGYRPPELHTDLDQTALHFFLDSPEHASERLIKNYLTLYPADSDEYSVLQVLSKAKDNGEKLTRKEIQQKTSLSEYRLRKVMSLLEARKQVVRTGKGNGTRYILGDGRDV